MVAEAYLINKPVQSKYLKVVVDEPSKLNWASLVPAILFTREVLQAKHSNLAIIRSYGWL